MREAQVSAKLAHRNIVTIFDIGEDNGRLFIVMELLKGETLDRSLKQLLLDRGEGRSHAGGLRGARGRERRRFATATSSPATCSFRPRAG